MATKLVSIRMPEDLLIRLRALASDRGDMGYQQLIKSYVVDGVYRDNPQLSGPIADAKDPLGGQVDVLYPAHRRERQPDRQVAPSHSIVFSSGDQLTTGGAYHHNIIFVEK